MVAPHQRRQARSVPGLKPAFGPTGTEHSPSGHGRGEPFELKGAQSHEIKHTAQELAGALRNHDLARPCEGLQTRGKIWSLANHRLLARCSLADQIPHHHQPGCDANPYLECHIAVLFEGADCGHEVQSGSNGPLGLILVGARVAKIGQHSVTQIFRDMALIAGDHLGDAVIIGPNDITEILWIEVCCELG